MAVPYPQERRLESNRICRGVYVPATRSSSDAFETFFTA
jgi:hypothetical protein